MSWSHIYSMLVRASLFWEQYTLRYIDQFRRREEPNYLFHASSVLLYAILVTFFVVLLVDNTIIRKRLDLFELPHYQYVDPDGVLLSRPAYDNDPYFDEKQIDDFHSLGLMVTYNNLRHVFPASAHLVLTYELRTTTLALKDCTQQVYFNITRIAFILPVLHFIMATLVYAEGEKHIYDCAPSLPASAMFISILIFTRLQMNIAECTDELTVSGPPAQAVLDTTNTTHKFSQI